MSEQAVLLTYFTLIMSAFAGSVFYYINSSISDFYTSGSCLSLSLILVLMISNWLFILNPAEYHSNPPQNNCCP
jgi:hypothetical protein